MNKKKRNVLIVCLAVALMITAVLGTVAYMTASSSKTNTFKVGKFDKPTTDPDNPEQTIELDGYILEKKWDDADEHKLVPGGELDKDPQIGIGKGSEDAYVYAFVENPMVYTGQSEDATVIRDGSVYFKLNENWKFVAVDGVDYKTLNIDGVDYYTGGLFKYVGETNGVLSAASADAWTGTIFDKVTTGKDMNTAAMAADPNADLNIVVSAYIHQAKDGKGVSLETTADAAAADWAKGLN